MPLKALWDGHEIVSIFLPNEAWEELRASQRREPGRLQMEDGARGIGKVSKLGLPFFAHAPGQGTTATAPESVQHLTLKAEIARTCAEAGWTVDVEARGEGWVADVLASRGERRIAFEVQWSHQTDGDYSYRTDRYRAAGIDSVWLRRVAPNNWGTRTGPNVFDVPARATTAASEVEVEVPWAGGGHQLVAVREFANAVLDRRIRPIGAEVSVWRENCWSNRCGKPLTLWVVEGEHAWPTHRTLARAARGHIRPQSGATLAKIESRTTQGSGKTYDAFCCPHCNSVIGDNYVWDHVRRYQYIRYVYLPGQATSPWCAVPELTEAKLHRPPWRTLLGPKSARPRPAEGDVTGDRTRQSQAAPVPRAADPGDVVHRLPPAAALTTRVPEAGSPTQVWVERCWRQACNKPFTVWAVKGEPPAPKTRTSARAVMDRISPIGETPLMKIEVRKVEGWETPYDSPCCPWCHLPGRDYFFDATKRARSILGVRENG